MRRRWFKWTCAILFLGCIISCATAFFWSAKELEREWRLVRQALFFFEGMRFEEADRLFLDLDSRRFTRMLRYLGVENPYVFLLRGKIALIGGTYESATGFFQKAIDSCARQGAIVRYVYVSQEKCRDIMADAYAYTGDAIVRALGDKAFSRAIAVYEKSLEIRPDDLPTKRMLEWLLFQEELFKQGLKKGGIPVLPGGRGVKSLFGLRPGFSDGADQKERKGY